MTIAIENNITPNSEAHNNVKACIYLMKPMEAERLLSNPHEHQRNHSPSRVQHLCSLILSDEFVLTGETVIVGASGRLLDGQHRLRACVSTGVPIWVVLVTGVPDKNFDFIDRGKTRSVGEVIGEHNRVVAAVIAADAIATGRLRQWGYVEAPDIRRFLEANPDFRDSVAASSKLRQMCIPSIAAALHYHFSQKDHSLTEWLFDKLAVGDELVKGSPVLMLRQQLIKNSISVKKLSRVAQAALLIKTWNAYRCGRTLKQLKFADDEAIPEIL